MARSYLNAVCPPLSCSVLGDYSRSGAAIVPPSCHQHGSRSARRSPRTARTCSCSSSATATLNPHESPDRQSVPVPKPAMDAPRRGNFALRPCAEQSQHRRLEHPRALRRDPSVTVLIANPVARATEQCPHPSASASAPAHRRRPRYPSLLPTPLPRDQILSVQHKRG